MKRNADLHRHPYRMLKHHPRATAIALGLAAGAGAIMVLLAVHPTYDLIQRHIDAPVYRYMTNHRVAPLTWLSYGLNLIGATVVTLPVRLITTIFLIVRRRWWFLSAFLLAVVSSEVLIGFLKSAYDRPRPPHSLVATSGASFPSGHAVATAVTAVALVIILIRPGPERRKWEMWAIVVTMLMGFSRAYLGAHWLTDAVGGVLIGSSLAVGSAVIVQAIRNLAAERALAKAPVASEQAREEMPEPGPLDTSVPVEEQSDA